MADLSAVTDKYFTIASETFADNLSAGIAALATTVPVNNASEYTNGDDCVITVEPGTVNEATFIGRKNGNQFENCVWTEGNTAVGHSSGATVIDYDSATHHNAQSKGILQFANPNGTLKTQPVRDALGLGATAANGWEVAPYTFSVTSGYNKGNREFDITVASNDVTDEYSVGERLKFTRNTVPPTQCLSLTSASSQYLSSATGTGIAFTDTWTAEAFIKQGVYNANAPIICRGGTGAGDWGFRTNVSGQIEIFGNNAASAGKIGVTSVAVPQFIWTHIAATLTMSTGACTVYINGISVPVTVTNLGAGAVALAQGGPVYIGKNGAAANYFDGKISDVRLWNAVRTQTQIRDNMYMNLVGTETNLVGYWKLANSLTDSTTNANTMTASGGALTTNADYPYTATEYVIIVKAVYGAPNTTLTVISSDLGGIPNMTLTAPYYSAQRSPYGFPADKMRWRVLCQANISLSSTNITAGTFLQLNANLALQVPTGAWKYGYKGFLQMSASGSASSQAHLSMGTAIPTTYFGRTMTSSYDAGAQFQGGSLYADDDCLNTAATVYSLYTTYTQGTAAVTNQMRGDLASTLLFAESNYV